MPCEVRHQEPAAGPLPVSAAPWTRKGGPTAGEAAYLWGEALRPYWLPVEEAQGRLPVILDPGLFGTGSHPSHPNVSGRPGRPIPGSRVVDLGSGSGVLSIAALRLGTACAVGVDIDPKAEDANPGEWGLQWHVHPRFQAFTGDVAGPPGLWRR